MLTRTTAKAKARAPPTTAKADTHVCTHGLVQGDIMTPQPPLDASERRVSRITLALMEDTGWHGSGERGMVDTGW
eukprot:360102-Chlamydomonas_euryale.AAC.10